MICRPEIRRNGPVVPGALDGKYSTRSQTLAVKIVRQPKKIALIGAPSSAAGFALGTEKAPAALRSAGLAERLQAVGYAVVDHGDCAQRLFADDDEQRRARNLAEIVAGLNDLRTRAGPPAKVGGPALGLGGARAQADGWLGGSGG